MSQATIQSTLNTISNQQVTNQFGTQRNAIFFEPGTYGSAASPLMFTVGYYTSVAGLGQNPSQVVINGAFQAFNQCPGGVQTNCNATDNFWRSLSNLTINVMGNTGCYAGDDFWAVSQAAPMRRVQVNGNLSLMDYCTGSPDFASGGFIADSRFTGGTVTNGSQQQFIVRNSSLDGWSNSVWNQVFCGDPGAPAQCFAANSGDSRRPELVHHAGDLPAQRGGALPLHRLLRQLQRVRAVPADQLLRSDLDGYGQHARHLAVAEHLLRRDAVELRSPRSTPRWPTGTT